MSSATISTSRPSPGFTPVPDLLFDALFPLLSKAELKVYLYLLRRTLGFGRQADAVSISRMARGKITQAGAARDKGLGLSPRTIQRALRKLEQRGLICIEPRWDHRGGRLANLYSLTGPAADSAHAPAGQKSDMAYPPVMADTPPTAAPPPPYGSTAAPLRQPRRDIRETVYRDTEHHQERVPQPPAYPSYAPEPCSDDVFFFQKQKKENSGSHGDLKDREEGFYSIDRCMTGLTGRGPPDLLHRQEFPQKPCNFTKHRRERLPRLNRGIRALFPWLCYSIRSLNTGKAPSPLAGKARG